MLNACGILRHMSDRRDLFEDMSNQPLVDAQDVTTRFSRAGGPGGQNVNKRSTKADVRAKLSDLRSLSAEQIEHARKSLSGSKRYIPETDEVIVTSRETRYQGQNERIALEKLNIILQEAIKIEQERRATKIPRSAQRRRVEDKRIAGRAKQERRRGWDD